MLRSPGTGGSGKLLLLVGWRRQERKGVTSWRRGHSMEAGLVAMGHQSRKEAGNQSLSLPFSASPSPPLVLLQVSSTGPNQTEPESENLSGNRASKALGRRWTITRPLLPHFQLRGKNFEQNPNISSKGMFCFQIRVQSSHCTDGKTEVQGACSKSHILQDQCEVSAQS